MDKKLYYSFCPERILSQAREIDKNVSDDSVAKAKFPKMMVAQIRE